MHPVSVQVNVDGAGKKTVRVVAVREGCLPSGGVFLGSISGSDSWFSCVEGPAWSMLLAALSNVEKRRAQTGGKGDHIATYASIHSKTVNACIRSKHCHCATRTTTEVRD